MDLMRITQDEIIEILKLYNIKKETVKEDIEIIKIWKSTQPHLHGDLTDDFIEKLLLKNKFSVEKCKQKIENYYTLRGANKDLIEGCEKIVPSKEGLTYLPMPNLTPNFERIVIMKITNPDLSIYNLLKMFKLALGINEIMLRHDFSMGCRFILDYQGFTLKHLATWNPVQIMRYYSLAEKAYSLRIMGFENINYPPFINKVFAIFKMFLRPKIYERIRLHENLESLHKVIPKEYLPEDYGGTNSDITNLLEKWDNEMKKQEQFLVDCLKYVSNEDLRPPEMQDNELFGTGGTFKKLSLD